MLCKDWTDDVSGYLEELKEAGLDGVEVSLFGAREDVLKKIFKEAKRNQLDIMCGTGVSEETNPSSKEEPVREKAKRYLEHAVDIASEAGGLCINGVLYAPWQGFAKGESKSERWNRSAQVLNQVGDYAKTKNIRLNCEVINRFESDFMNTLEEGHLFLKEISSQQISLLADIFHMNIEEDSIEDAFKQYIQDIGCIHISENHRGVPGTGHILWNDIIKGLMRLKYDGYLILETFVETGTQVAEGMNIWRNISANPSIEEAKKGIKYVKEVIEMERGVCESV